MFTISKNHRKHARYIDDYNYPVGMDTRPSITFGVADNIFSGNNSYWHFSFRQFFTSLLFPHFQNVRKSAATLLENMMKSKMHRNNEHYI